MAFLIDKPHATKINAIVSEVCATLSAMKKQLFKRKMMSRESDSAALTLAARRGHIGVDLELITRGANVSAANLHGDTASFADGAKCTTMQTRLTEETVYLHDLLNPVTPRTFPESVTAVFNVSFAATLGMLPTTSAKSVLSK